MEPSSSSTPSPRRRHEPRQLRQHRAKLKDASPDSLQALVATFKQRATLPLSDRNIAALVELQHTMAVSQTLIETILAGRVTVSGKRDGKFLYAKRPRLIVEEFNRAPWPVSANDFDEFMDLVVASSTSQERDFLLSKALAVIHAAGRTLADAVQAVERRVRPMSA